MLRTKLSRAIFLVVVVLAFVLLHFTTAFDSEGLKFSELFKAIAHHPVALLVYLAYLFIPALVASFVIPWSVRWVKSGS